MESEIDRIVQELSEKSLQYRELKNTLDHFEKINHLEVSFPNRNGFVQVDLTEVNKLKVLIDIGLGVYLEASLLEAKKIAETEAQRLSEKADSVERAFAQSLAEEYAKQLHTEMQKEESIE